MKFNIGSVIVFVPNVKTGQTLKNNLFKVFQNYSKVNPLQVRINKNESIQNFDERLLNDIDKALVERSENPAETFDKHEINNDDDIFIFPIGNVNDEEKQLIQSTLPPPLVEKKLVRIIISTNQNEHFIKYLMRLLFLIQDLLRLNIMMQINAFIYSKQSHYQITILIKKHIN